MSIHYRQFISKYTKHTFKPVKEKIITQKIVSLCSIYKYFLQPLADDIYEFLELSDDPFQAALDSIAIHPEPDKMRAIALAIWLLDKETVDPSDTLAFIKLLEKEIKKMPVKYRALLSI